MMRRMQERGGRQFQDIEVVGDAYDREGREGTGGRFAPVAAPWRGGPVALLRETLSVVGRRAGGWVYPVEREEDIDVLAAPIQEVRTSLLVVANSSAARAAAVARADFECLGPVDYRATTAFCAKAQKGWPASLGQGSRRRHLVPRQALPCGVPRSRGL